MNSEDFYILHLSDLHIRNEAANQSSEFFYSTSLMKLINDIDMQTKEINNLILVISGDIIDQGNYDTHESAALKFFQDLSDKIVSRVCKVIIVPGNHDKCRSKKDTLISMSHMQVGLKNDFKDRNSSEEEWELHKEAYSRFIELSNRIYNIFALQKKINNTFGLDSIVVNKDTICFLSMDSAWCSHSKNDYRKLRVGEYQLNKLSSEYKIFRNQSECQGYPVKLTILISHHPLNWLTPDEEQLCNEYFLSEEFLNVDILMCGHVHDFSVVNHFNHTHSLLTLVTGIGWGVEKPQDKEIHRYSIYHLNLFYNACDIVMRKIETGKDFDYDYSVYTGKAEIEDKKLRYPLKVKESSPFIRINAPEPHESKSLFLDTNSLNQIPKVAKVISSFTDNVARLYSRYKENFLADVSQQIHLNDKQRLDLQHYFYENKQLSETIKNNCFRSTLSLEYFTSFLTDICSSVVQAFEECFSNNVILRAHFRWHCFEENRSFASEKVDSYMDSYPMLCQYSNISDEKQTNTMQLVPWGGLIKPAFITNCPMIFSANRNKNSITTLWDDFITIVPQFNGSTHDIRLRKGNNEPRPIITFGISVKNLSINTDKSFLYLLSFLRFDKILSELTDEYVSIFEISTKDFISYMQKMRNNL